MSGRDSVGDRLVHLFKTHRLLDASCKPAFQCTDVHPEWNELVATRHRDDIDFVTDFEDQRTASGSVICPLLVRVDVGIDALLTTSKEP